MTALATRRPALYYPTRNMARDVARTARIAAQAAWPHVRAHWCAALFVPSCAVLAWLAMALPYQSYAVADYERHPCSHHERCVSLQADINAMYRRVELGL